MSSHNAEPPAPALRLHHIGHAVASLSAAATGFRDRFGYREVSAPIHDPLQTAFVQFLQLDPLPIFLELVAPDSPASKLTAAVRQGGGLHHLCYTSPSLETSVTALSSAGMHLISDPQPAIAFAGRRICWLLGPDRSLVELIERQADDDPCHPIPGPAPAASPLEPDRPWPADR